MQGNWTLCVPLKYLIADIQEVKCLEFTVKILHPPPASPIEGPRGGGEGPKKYSFHTPLASARTGLQIQQFLTK